jgi:hypothetical protein
MIVIQIIEVKTFCIANRLRDGQPRKHSLIPWADKRCFSISETSDMQCIGHGLLFRDQCGAPFPGKIRSTPSSVEVTNKCNPISPPFYAFMSSAEIHCF